MADIHPRIRAVEESLRQDPILGSLLTDAKRVVTGMNEPCYEFRLNGWQFDFYIHTNGEMDFFTLWGEAPGTQNDDFDIDLEYVTLEEVKKGLRSTHETGS